MTCFPVPVCRRAARHSTKYRGCGSPRIGASRMRVRCIYWRPCPPGAIGGKEGCEDFRWCRDAGWRPWRGWTSMPMFGGFEADGNRLSAQARVGPSSEEGRLISPQTRRSRRRRRVNMAAAGGAQLGSIFNSSSISSPRRSRARHRAETTSVFLKTSLWKRRGSPVFFASA